MKHQGLASVPAIFLDFAHNHDVIAAIESPSDVTNEMRRRSFQQGTAAGVSDGVDQVRSAGKDLNRRAQKIVALAQDHVQDAMEAGQAAYSQAKKA
jgi:hypothetical protein